VLLAIAAAIAMALVSRSLARPEAPEEFVRGTAELVMGEIRDHADEYSSEPDRLYRLIEEQVVPRFDVAMVSQQVLGQYWGQATPGQRARFMAAFQFMLVRTYAHSLLAYKDDPFEWYPPRAAPGAEDVTVRSSIGLSDGSPMALNYRVRFKDGEWRVYDISIDGVSLIVNYRGMFTHEIRKNGLDALIGRMEMKNAPAP
jgi:phospholipid transport system substrate-binding protein